MIQDRSPSNPQVFLCMKYHKRVDHYPDALVDCAASVLRNTQTLSCIVKVGISRESLLPLLVKSHPR